MAVSGLSARLRADVAELSRLAGRDVAGLLKSAPDAVVAERVLVEALDELVQVYGQASGTLAADFYDEVREQAKVAGRFRAQVAELPTVGRAESLAGWAAHGGVVGDVFDLAKVIARVEGGMQRIIADMARNTVTRSSVRDPRARGWQRVGVGECGFCRILIDRGAVYTRESVDFGSHDNCRCGAVPAWGGQEIPVKPYEGTDRKVSDADRARVRQWMAQHGYTD